MGGEYCDQKQKHDKGGEEKHKKEESPRYHTPIGTKLKLYDVGWTTEGREYYNTLMGTFQFLKSNEQFWINMNNHWMVYENQVLTRGCCCEQR